MSDETRYLRARYAEEEAFCVASATADLDRLPTIQCKCGRLIYLGAPGRAMADLAAKRKILDFDELWPVLVEGPPSVEVTDLASASMAMVQEIAWMTTLEYRKRFGDDPPTSAVISALLQPYADRDDFDPRWLV